MELIDENTKAENKAKRKAVYARMDALKDDEWNDLAYILSERGFDDLFKDSKPGVS